MLGSSYYNTPWGWKCGIEKKKEEKVAILVDWTSEL
jgi:hypothetical protein